MRESSIKCPENCRIGVLVERQRAYGRRLCEGAAAFACECPDLSLGMMEWAGIRYWTGNGLSINDFSYLVNGNYETFLDATDSVGTFATSNLEKPYGWTLRNGHGQVYQATGFTVIFR